MIFILPSISGELKFQSGNHTSTDKNSESNVFENIKFSSKMPNNWPNNLLETNVYKTHEFCWQLLLATLQCINNTSVMSKQGTFWTF